MRWVNKLGNAKIKQPLSGRELKAQGASLKGEVLARCRQQELPVSVQNGSGYQSQYDDDIPF